MAHNPLREILTNGQTDLTIEYNLVFPHTSGHYTGGNAIIAEPKFVSATSTSGNDFKLTSTSPAIDNGTTNGTTYASKIIETEADLLTGTEAALQNTISVRMNLVPETLNF